MSDPIYDRLTALLHRRYQLDTAMPSLDATVADLGLNSMFVDELMLVMPDMFSVETTDVPCRHLTLAEIGDWPRERGARP